MPNPTRGVLIKLIRAVRGHPRSVIARMNGQALGGRIGLVTACDIATAADHPMLGVRGLRLGLWPMIVTAVLLDFVSRKALFEMMAAGRLLRAEEAVRAGIASRIVPVGELGGPVDEAIATLAV